MFIMHARGVIMTKRVGCPRFRLWEDHLSLEIQRSVKIGEKGNGRIDRSRLSTKPSADHHRGKCSVHQAVNHTVLPPWRTLSLAHSFREVDDHISSVVVIVCVCVQRAQVMSCYSGMFLNMSRVRSCRVACEQDRGP